MTSTDVVNSGVTCHMRRPPGNLPTARPKKNKREERDFRQKRILQGSDGSDADQRNILKGGHEGREENQSEAAAPLNGGDRIFTWILLGRSS